MTDVAGPGAGSSRVVCAVYIHPFKVGFLLMESRCREHGNHGKKYDGIPKSHACYILWLRPTDTMSRLRRTRTEKEIRSDHGNTRGGGGREVAW